MSNVFRLRDALLSTFRAAYAEHDVIEVTSPCLVQTQVEGDSTLFKLDYYSHPTYLTQSFQLYRETCLTARRCILRAEEFLCREQPHASPSKRACDLEADLAFITFGDLTKPS